MSRYKSLTTSELKMIMESGLSDKELSEKLGRSVTSIQTTRSRYAPMWRKSKERK